MTNKGQCAACGQPNEYTKLICDFCGARLPWAPQRPPQAVTPPPISPPSVYPQTMPPVSIINNDAPSTGYFLLGFFIPIVGFILYLVENGSRPQRAASAGKGALWGVGTTFVTSFLVIVLLSILGNNVKHQMDAARQNTTTQPVQ